MALPEISGLLRLPYELIAYIVEDLDIEDVFHWSLCNRYFQFIIRQDRFCKPVVLSKGRATLEAQEALETGRFSRALRRLAKRHSAVSQASPYFVGIVACADSYGLFGGKLCYTLEEDEKRTLRILDIHKSTDWELVVNISVLIRIACPMAAGARHYKFRVLYQAAGIVSCLFSFALAGEATQNWLLILKPQEHQLLERVRLASSSRIFVRNNANFLYYGTHSWVGADGLRRWVIKGFDLSTRSWLPGPRLFLSNLAGCDIGTTVCFEIFGDYFYGLSNQNFFEADDPEWTSYYYCFRFPLDEPSLEKTQVMEDKDSWRRNHTEGPINDRWGFLSLEADEATGVIVILECRRELRRGQSGSQRKYYTTEVIFRSQTIQEDHRRAGANTRRRVIDHLQCDTPIPIRRPEYVHAGDDSSIASQLVRSKTYYCAYIRCCHTFIDLFDESLEDECSPQQLRLRTGYRRLKPDAQLMLENSPPSTPQTLGESPEPPATQPYQANTIYVWPPDDTSPDLGPSLGRVRGLLDLEGTMRCVTARGDERSVIYEAEYRSKDYESPEYQDKNKKKKEPMKNLVFLSFDPAAKFRDMENGGSIVGQRISHDHEEGGGLAKNEGSKSQFSPNVPLGAAARCSKADGPTTSLPSWTTSLASSAEQHPPSLRDPEGTDAWVCYQGAMHLVIPRKFCFAR
ncbi:hypothetical protein NUW58_g5931 [Xylaria curta]|uniref:Uncharacterized protein n=1 Tax=Xylaria curta TaxID=42375 RepID=A0ACC1P0E4_9PEZI|nr:hypothetical protein NUW58_g5931 [Xylaria curta]